MRKIMIDTRTKNKVESMFEYQDGICSIKFKDLNDTFWFDNVNQLQEFINQIEKERYFDKSLCNGYFEYINEHNEKIRYYTERKYCSLQVIKEEFVLN